jgi:hypothetical protein
MWRLVGSLLQPVLARASRHHSDTMIRYLLCSAACGESVVGWGGAAPDARVVTELVANGSEVLDVSLTPAAVPYRAVKVPLATLDIASMRLNAAKE